MGLFSCTVSICFTTQAKGGEDGGEEEDEEGHYSNLLGDEEGKEDIRYNQTGPLCYTKLAFRLTGL